MVNPLNFVSFQFSIQFSIFTNQKMKKQVQYLLAKPLRDFLVRREHASNEQNNLSDASFFQLLHHLIGNVKV